MSYFSDISSIYIFHSLHLYKEDYTFVSPSNSLELLRNGQLNFRCGDVCRELKAPVMFWLREGEKYTISDPVHRPVEHIFCNITGPRSDRIVESLDELCPEGYLVPRDLAGVTKIFFEILNFYRMGKQYYHPEMVVCIEKLLQKAVETFRSPTRPDHDPYHIWKTGEEIRKNPFRDFDFEVMAIQEGLSLDHYRRIFRAAHKVPPMEFVRSQRMIQAAELLTMTDMRIKEIVYNCRFKSLMEFSRSFKRYFGESPRNYRNMHIANR